MKKIFHYFLQGVVFFTPIALTLYLVIATFIYIDQWFKEYLMKIIGIDIPGLGIIVLFLLITLLGFFGQSIIGKPFRLLIERLLTKTPGLNTIYSSIKEVSDALMGRDKKFTRPVMVKVNLISDLEKMGFLVHDDLPELGLKDKVAVYFPHAYNISGELFFVPKDQVRPLNISPTEAMKFMATGGVLRNFTQS
jgi:uncharacterized membrane protein